jgi:hypothetical protein
MRRFFKLSICAALIGFAFLPIHPPHAFANGAVFQRGSESGAPGPVKQTELYLQKEHVIFRDNEVVARFWVQNPADRDIPVTMGFPLYYGPYFGQKDNNLNDEERIQFASKINSAVSITSQGKAFKLEMKEQEKGPYRLTFLWEMTYPAGKLTEFTVKYPMDRNWHSADGSGEHAEFVYITHTGASWARPIEEALFEYYDDDFVKFITNYYPGPWWEDDKTQLEVHYVVSPQPYAIDLEQGKIVWQRRNWTPRTNKDDIRVSLGWKYNVGAPGVDTHTSDPSSFGLLCGDEYPGDDGRAQHFAETTRLESVKYNRQTFQDEIFHKAYEYRKRYESNPAIAAHMELAEKLEVLKYVRNYLAARHGHTFKDEGLAECYRNVKPKKSWSDAEKANLQLIQELEKTLASEYRKALSAIKNEMLDMELFRGALFGWQFRDYAKDRLQNPEKKMATE